MAAEVAVIFTQQHLDTERNADTGIKFVEPMFITHHPAAGRHQRTSTWVTYLASAIRQRVKARGSIVCTDQK